MLPRQGIRDGPSADGDLRQGASLLELVDQPEEHLFGGFVLFDCPDDFNGIPCPCLEQPELELLDILEVVVESPLGDAEGVGHTVDGDGRDPLGAENLQPSVDPVLSRLW